MNVKISWPMLGSVRPSVSSEYQRSNADGSLPSAATIPTATFVARRSSGPQNATSFIPEWRVVIELHPNNPVYPSVARIVPPTGRVSQHLLDRDGNGFVAMQAEQSPDPSRAL
jgi:hypothetical protein